jgi:hypothetical protein
VFVPPSLSLLRRGPITVHNYASKDIDYLLTIIKYMYIYIQRPARTVDYCCYGNNVAAQIGVVQELSLRPRHNTQHG